MNLSKYIIILSLANIICLREKLKIVNTAKDLFPEEDTPNVIFVFSHMKHGASSPCYGLNDYYADIFEQQWKGYCELTNKGFLQLFKLGKIFKQRYDQLLNISYDPDINKILSYASKENKTLMSSNALLYGMFYNNKKPKEEQIVVPTRNFKKIEDYDLIPIFYFSDINNCKGWKNQVNKQNLNEIKELNDFISRFVYNYGNVFNIFKFKQPITKIDNWFDKINLFCTSFISNYYDERHKKIDMFEELKYSEEQFYDLYYDCNTFNLYKYIYIQYNGESKKIPPLILSDLLGDMFNYMDLAINGTDKDTPKFLSYMGHDSTIAAMQVILNQLFSVPYKLMPFGSNQIFLLFKKDNKYEIQYFYNDKFLLKMDYNEFKNSIQTLIESNKNDLIYFCRGFQIKDYTIIVLISTILALIIANISICLYHRNIFCDKKKYMSIEPTGKSVEIKNEV